MSEWSHRGCIGFKENTAVGGFIRSFTLDETIDVTNISAKYEDGVLHVSLPLIAGKEATRKEVVIN